MTNDYIFQDDGGLPDDEIVAEVRAIRAEVARAVGYDLGRHYEQLKAIETEELKKGRQVISPEDAAGRPGAAA